MVVRYILRNLYASTIYREEATPIRRAHAGLKLASFILVIAAGFMEHSLLGLALLFAYPVIVGLLDDWEILAYSVKAPLIPALMVGVLTALLSPAGPLTAEAVVEGARLAARLLLMAMLLVLYMSTTHPQRLVSMLSSLRAPLWLAEAVEISWRLIPLSLRDTDEALASMRLKGLRPWSALVPVTAVALERAKGMAEAMYVRGLGLSPRKKTLRGTGSPAEALPLLAAAIALTLLELILLP